METLKKCPFCGCAGTTRLKYEGAWIAECSNQSCPASYMIGAKYDTAQEAVDAWNTRISGVGKDAVEIIKERVSNECVQ